MTELPQTCKECGGNCSKTERRICLAELDAHYPDEPVEESRGGLCDVERLAIEFAARQRSLDNRFNNCAKYRALAERGEV